MRPSRHSSKICIVSVGTGSRPCRSGSLANTLLMKFVYSALSSSSIVCEASESVLRIVRVPRCLPGTMVEGLSERALAASYTRVHYQHML